MLPELMLRCGRAFFALLAVLALAACSAGDTTEDATNSLMVRTDRAVTSWLGGTVPPPPPVVETPAALPDARRPNLGDVPARPSVVSPENRYAALAELAQQRAEALEEDRRLAATSPFRPEGQQGAPDAAGRPPSAPATAQPPAAAPAPAPPIPAAQPAAPRVPPAQAAPEPTPAIAIGPGRSLASVVFGTNSATLGEPQRQAVRAAAAQLGGAGPVRVIGFAGAGLPPQEAATLARARAEAVAAELRQAGVPAARIQVQAPGSGSGRQVEIVVDL
jgi:outer membrane protein OmpA-like peptidoglycan-associated protein